MILDGLRVLDRSTSLAGAWCAKLLTDLGADVVRVEPPEGDPRRDDGLGGDHWAYLRTSQRSITDDTAWAPHADLIVQDDSLSSPALVTVAISQLGTTGPDAHLNALRIPEAVLQARSGALSGHGHMTHPPLTVNGELGEYVAGVLAAVGGLTTWRRARATGVAETVDVSILEAMQLTMLTMPTLFARFPDGRPGAFRFVMIPGNEPCADGNYVGITTNTVAQWQSLLRAAGRDDLAEDRELHTMIGRFMRAAEVTEVLQSWTRSRPAAEIEQACIEHRVPVAVVGNGRVLLEFDHLQAREVFVPQPGGDVVRPRSPFRMHLAADRPMAPAPRVGEHAAAPPWGPRSAPTASPVGERPLAGVRVLDLTAFWAGPFGTAWLSAMGADVIKVEAVQRPDGMRMAGTTRHGKDDALECSPLFHASNLGKRGITLDLTRPEGVELAKSLAAWADVVVENFTPRVMEDFGLGHEVLLAIKPELLVVRMPAFGLTGPWRDRPGFAQTMEQLSGMAWTTGYEGGPPIIAGGVVDPMVGAHAALAMVAALEHRERTGRGGLVELAMVDVAVATTADQVIRYQRTGEVGDRRGARGVYRAAGDDRWIAIDEARDPLDAEARAAWCAERTPEVAQAELLAAGIPAFAVVPGFAALDDRQLQARGYFEPVSHAIVGEQHYPGWAMRISGGPERYWTRPAPMLGEHDDEVLREVLGLADDEIAALRAEGIVAPARDV